MVVLEKTDNDNNFDDLKNVYINNEDFWFWSTYKEMREVWIDSPIEKATITIKNAEKIISAVGALISEATKRWYWDSEYVISLKWCIDQIRMESIKLQQVRNDAEKNINRQNKNPIYMWVKRLDYLISKNWNWVIGRWLNKSTKTRYNRVTVQTKIVNDLIDDMNDNAHKLKSEIPDLNYS